MKTKWIHSKAEETGKHLGVVEFKSNNEEWHNFEVFETEDKFVFGGFCNIGFMESGYMLKEDGDLSDLVADLKCYYNEDSPSYSLVHNERM